MRSSCGFILQAAQPFSGIRRALLSTRQCRFVPGALRILMAAPTAESVAEREEEEADRGGNVNTRHHDPRRAAAPRSMHVGT